MKKLNIVFVSFYILCIFILTNGSFVNGQSGSGVDISGFLGQWTLDISGGAVGWLEVRQEKGYVDGDLLWIGGSVLPVANIFLDGSNKLIVTRTNPLVRAGVENRTHTITSWLEVSKGGDKVSGYLYNPRRNGLGVDSTFFTGTKLPEVPPAPDLSRVRYGKPVVLFNGKDLAGWRSMDEKRQNAFKVIDGVLVNDAVKVEGQPQVRYANLRTEQEFKDFNLKVEVNVPAGSNSGIYLRGMYEIQILDSYGRDPDSHNMGAVYSRITPAVQAEKPAGTWQTLDITLCNRHITVILNGIKIIDNKPVHGPTGGAIISDVFAPGPIYLQGDHGKVSFRNIILTPIL